jgi:hypothetical protein
MSEKNILYSNILLIVNEPGIGYASTLVEESKKIHDFIQKSDFKDLLIPSNDIEKFSISFRVKASDYIEKFFKKFFTANIDIDKLRYKCDELQSYIESYQKYTENVDKFKQDHYYIYTLYKLLYMAGTLPSKFKSYLHNQPTNAKAHLDVIKVLLDKKEDTERLVEKYKNVSAIQSFDESLTNYEVIKALQYQMIRLFAKHQTSLLKNQWKIPLYSKQILDYINCTLLDTTKNTESDVAICDFLKTSRYIVLKCAKINNSDYDVLLHEFVIGSILNKLRNETNNFCFTYFGFFCTPFNRGIEELCSISDNTYSLSTIVASEYCGRTTLYDFFKQSTTQQQYDILLQILYSLCIAQHSFSFVHGDLHSNNIFVRELKEVKTFKYNLYRLNKVKVISTKYIPQIIDFGRSICSVNDILLKPFTQKPDVQIEQKKQDMKTIEDMVLEGFFLPSFDWIRLLISLTNVADIKVLKKFTKLYYDKMENTQSKFYDWLKFVHEDAKLHSSKIVLTNTKDLNMCTVNIHEVLHYLN